MNARLLRPSLVLVAGFLLAVSAFRAAAQAPFTNQPVAGFPQTPLLWGSAAWGDYDNDGKLDLILIGTTNLLVPIMTGMSSSYGTTMAMEHSIRFPSPR